MKALLLSRQSPVETSPLRLAEVPEPNPPPGSLLVRVRACGVCRTDLHIVEGELPAQRLPLIPGHQIVGEVVAAGDEADRVRIGERVGIPWLYSTCGECAFCRRGQENLCQRAQFTGWHVDGGYAEYVVAPAASAYPLPAGFSDEQVAPLLCAGVIGYRTLRLSGVGPGERVGLYGFGASAHVVIQIARHWDCEVYVFSRTPEHRELALALGAAWVGDARDEPPALLDGAVVFAPAGWIAREALRVTRQGGTVALAGIYMSPIPEVDYNLIYHERVLRSAANSTRQDVREVLRLASEIPIRTEVEKYPMEAANRALAEMKASEISGAGVLEIG